MFWRKKPSSPASLNESDVYKGSAEVEHRGVRGVNVGSEKHYSGSSTPQHSSEALRGQEGLEKGVVPMTTKSSEYPSSSVAGAPLLSSSASPKHMMDIGERDLEQLTGDDIQDLLFDMKACRTHPNQEKCQVLEKAMRYLLEQQRFSDVIGACPPSVLRAARSAVKEEDYLIARRLFSEKLSLLYGVLPFLPLSLLKSDE